MFCSLVRDLMTFSSIVMLDGDGLALERKAESFILISSGC